ncbi:MipA/OmpV family protein [Herbaspirillum sp. SJZ099]|uniref:MipA/OmpV family protein n=1 Tax=Herbaspirillum sp. SJZ099 TaxID=2572916 RepID=UPI001C96179C|nr:MipA/OmpV family protein [Herbaspirillum sp. SJZ099]
MSRLLRQSCPPMALLAVAALAVLAAPTQAAEAPKGDVFTLGAGVAIGPRYSGSDQNRAGLGLAVDYAASNGFFIGTTRGIGYGSQAGKLDYSIALGYREGRKDSSQSSFMGRTGSDYLRGMGEIKGSVTTLLGLGYTVTDWLRLGLQAEVPLSQRDNGSALHFSASSPFYTSDSDRLTLGLTSSWGNRKYVQTYYGVTAAQSAASGFRQHGAKSGIYAYALELGWKHKFDANWSLMASVGAMQLAGDAGNSPIVKRKTAPMGSVFVTYSY